MPEADPAERGSFQFDVRAMSRMMTFDSTYLAQRIRRAALALGAAGVVASVAPFARADGTADLRGLLEQTVVTTASKTKETSSNAPATSTTLTADDMRRYGIRTIDEAINFLSLGATSYNPFYTPDVSVRGVGLEGDQGNHVLLLVDGHAMNDALFGSARFGRGVGLPIELVDHIEVILGPGSVLYGSSAMLGVVNIVTKRAREHQGGHLVVETEVPISYRGNVTAGVPFRLFGTPGELVLGVEYYQSDGPQLQFGPRNIGINAVTGLPWGLNYGRPADGTWGGTTENTPFARVPSAYLSARVGDFRLRVQASTFKFAAPFRGRRIQDVALFDDPNSYQIDRSLRGDLTWERALSEVFTPKIRAYIDSFDNRTFMTASDFLYCRRNIRACQWGAVGVARWGGAELQGSFNWTRDGRLVTLIGVDGRLRFVQGRNEVSNFDTGAPLFPLNVPFKREVPSLGSYVQTTWQPAAVFGMNAGARLDYDPRFDPVVSPRLAATTKPWGGGTLKAVYAEAFRAPTFIESETYGAILLPPRDLVPETVRSIEGSLEQRFGSQRILFGVFRSWWSNMIESHQLTAAEKVDEVARGNLDLSVSVGAVSQYRNVATIENYGFNGTYEGTAAEGRLRYGANVTGAVARWQSGGIDRQMPLVPRIFGNLRVSYDLQGNLPVFALATHFTGSRIADRAWDGGFMFFPVAPPQAELRGTISGPVPGLTGLSYRVLASYRFGSRGPYVVGFSQGGNDLGRDYPELVPVDTFRTTVGLQYDFLQ
jgi:outer membrane receptor for ferrienterochelin and colicins